MCLMARMNRQRPRFSQLHAPGPRLTWVPLTAIALTIGLPVAGLLEWLF